MHFITHRLRWDDVRPEVRAFDPEIAKVQIVTLFRNLPAPQELGGYWWEDRIEELLVEHFGVWLCGWRSGADGGPVTTCLDKLEPSAPDRSANQVIAAVEQWWAFLRQVDEVFQDLPVLSPELLPETLERAANRLLTMG